MEIGAIETIAAERRAEREPKRIERVKVQRKETKEERKKIDPERREQVEAAMRKREERKQIEKERIAEATSLEPHAHDVLCGRGGLSNHHPGNEWFRRLVRSNRSQYHSVSKHVKLLVAKAIVQAIQEQDPPGRFIKLREYDGDGKRDSKEWESITYAQAVHKTSQALREKDTRERSNETHKRKRKRKELKQRTPSTEHNSASSVGANLGIGEETITFEGLQNPSDQEQVEEELRAASETLKKKKLVEECKQSEPERKAQEETFDAKRLAEAKAAEETLRAKILEAERELLEAKVKAAQAALEAKRIEGERKQREAEERAAKEVQKIQKLEAERRRIEAETVAAQEALEALHTKKLDEERKQRKAEAKTVEGMQKLRLAIPSNRRDEIWSSVIPSNRRDEIWSKIQQKVDNVTKQFSLPRSSNSTKDTRQPLVESTTVPDGVAVPPYKCSQIHSKKYPFPHKLFDLLREATSDDHSSKVVSWSSDGTIFTVHDQARFAAEFLPRYFGYTQLRNFGSQLKYWGFERISPRTINNKSFGGKSWKHLFFQKDREDLLKQGFWCKGLRNGK